MAWCGARWCWRSRSLLQGAEALYAPRRHPGCSHEGHRAGFLARHERTEPKRQTEAACEPTWSQVISRPLGGAPPAAAASLAAMAAALACARRSTRCRASSWRIAFSSMSALATS